MKTIYQTLSILLSMLLFSFVSLGQSSSEPWEAYQLDQLQKQLISSGKSYLPFLNRNTLKTGLYVLEGGAEDKQQPHELDEVYYIISGKANLRVEDDVFPVTTGSVVFVKAGAFHKFEGITEELQTLVFFSQAQP